jgi:uncharacterized membrane protein YfcA
MFTIVGAIIGASITSVIEPRLLYFFFAAFLSTSFFGIKRHRRQQMSTDQTVRPSVKQDRIHMLRRIFVGLWRHELDRDDEEIEFKAQTERVLTLTDSSL